MDPTLKTPIENENPTSNGMGKELGKSGTLIFNGYISGEEYNKKLIGKQAIRQYDIMRRSDATVHSMLIVCKYPIQSALWDVQAASEDETDQYIANFVKRELFDRNVNWTKFLAEGMSFLEFGHSVAEKTYEITEYLGKTRVGIKKLSFRRQLTIMKWALENGDPGITQQIVGAKAEIPLAKLIVFVNDQEGDNYDGVSVLRYVYKDWDMKDKLGLINAIALEKQAVGVPILKAPPDADESQLKAARESLRQMRANEQAFAEVPTGWDLQMMDMKANTTHQVIPSIQYHDRQIVRAILAQFLELGGGSESGSRALSEDHSRLFILSLEAVAKQIQSAVQDQLIKQLCDLNFSNLPNGYPTLTVSKISDDNVLTLAQSLNQLASAGMITPNVDTENYIRDIMNLPEIPEADEGEDTAEEHSETTLDEEQETSAKDNLKTDPKTTASLTRAKAARKELIDIIVKGE